MLNDYLNAECNLRHLYAEFKDGNIMFCGHTFPSGRFVTDVLGIPDSVIEEITDSALNAYLYSQMIAKGAGEAETFISFRDSVLKVFRIISGYPPFCYLDFDAEIKDINDFISEDSMSVILGKEHSLLQYIKHEGAEVKSNDILSPDQKTKLEADLAYMVNFINKSNAILSLPFSVIYFFTVMQTFSDLVVETRARSKSDLACVVNSLFTDDSYFKELDNDLFRVKDYLDYGQNVSIALVPRDSQTRQGETELVEQCLFPNFGQLLMYDFFKGLQAGHYTRKCENCGRYFFVDKATYQRFCNGADPNNSKRSCQTVGRQLPAGRRQSVNEMPAHVLWKADDELIRKHRQRGKIDETSCAAALSMIRGYYEEALCNNEYAVKQYYTDMELPNVYAKVGVAIR